MAAHQPRDPAMPHPAVIGARAHLASLNSSTSATATKPIKRQRSPDPAARILKRQRTDGARSKQTREERDKLEDEFRVQYTRGFGSWIFFFDDEHDPDVRATHSSRITSLNGTIASTFNHTVTHLITCQKDDDKADKENYRYAINSIANRHHLLARATASGIKVWSPDKLASVLDRLLDPPEVIADKQKARNKKQHLSQPQSKLRSSAPPPDPKADALTVVEIHPPAKAPTISKPSRELGILLHSEKLRGTTEERDPAAKRSDYQYFSRGVCFILCEDLNREETVIIAHEYPRQPTIKHSKADPPPWPRLYADPRAFNPFAPYSDRAERRRAEREMEMAEVDKLRQRAKQKLKQAKAERLKLEFESSVKAYAEDQQEQAGTEPRSIRRVRSLSEFKFDPPTHGDGELASGLNWPDASAGSVAYWGASGNSVPLSAATGTGFNSSIRSVDPNTCAMLPLSLKTRLRQPLRSLTLSTATEAEKENITCHGDKADRAMLAPQGDGTGLRRTKSTGGLGLRLKVHKKESLVVPKSGYCENCRIRFDDINEHVKSRRHLRFANEAGNFVALDFELARVLRVRKP
ncbi:hypothetical protein BKA62DRAFT_691935 [Auriculariales sp. MPI-PUGE-AT-0066]|nr:hypothetical protein BKA62DRAFT_691935 [Auriculariales sp. MPI-PUGE-AT-0066]